MSLTELAGSIEFPCHICQRVTPLPGHEEPPTTIHGRQIMVAIALQPYTGAPRWDEEPFSAISTSSSSQFVWNVRELARHVPVVTSDH